MSEMLYIPGWHLVSEVIVNRFNITVQFDYHYYDGVLIETVITHYEQQRDIQ